MFRLNHLVGLVIIFSLISNSFASKTNAIEALKVQIGNADKLFISKQTSEGKFGFYRSFPVRLNGLSLDFDNFNKVNSLSSLFFPESSSILNALSWTQPLHETGKLENVLKLKEYMDRIKRGLIDKSVDNLHSFNWVSSLNKMVSYVNIVSTTFNQLGYLSSRLEKTDDFIGKELLYASIRDYLKVLADFSSDLISRSGSFGVTLLIDRLHKPSKSFEFTRKCQNWTK